MTQQKGNTKNANTFVLDLNEKSDGAKWFSFDLGNSSIRLKLIPFSRSEIKELKWKYTTIEFDPKTHQKVEVEDPKKRDEVSEGKMVKMCVDWDVSEREKDGKIIKSEFTIEKYEKFLDKYGLWEIDKEIDSEGKERKVSLISAIGRILFNPGAFFDDDSENL